MKQIFTDSLRKKNLFANKNAEFIITLNFKSFFKMIHVFCIYSSQELQNHLIYIKLCQLFISRKTVV